MKKLIILILMLLSISILTGCQNDDLKCQTMFDKRTYIGFKDYNDCADWVSDTCNFNVTILKCGIPPE